MKRSEMIEIISQHIFDNMGVTTPNKLAKNILSLVEDHGMVPPERYNSLDNTWEPEEVLENDCND